jgi:glutathione S-transferase
MSFRDDPKDQTRNLEIPGSLASLAPRNDVSTIIHGEFSRMYHFTALVTCLAILFYFFTSTRVARARASFDVKAPAISGNPDFERVFRVQMNTLEWMPIFLPSLWLSAIYISDPIAAVLGLVWIAGRILYMTGYSQAANKRGRGFGIQALAAGILLFGALGMIAWRLVHG